MKRRVPKKVIAAAVAFAATLNMNGCGVYGPAADEDEVFDPKLNIEADVYGPPPAFDITEESTETAETDEFAPALNNEPCVYGPPEY